MHQADFGVLVGIFVSVSTAQETRLVTAEQIRQLVRPVRESHFGGLTWQVGWCIFHGLGGGWGGHVLQTLFSSGGGVTVSKFSRQGSWCPSVFQTK